MFFCFPLPARLSGTSRTTDPDTPVTAPENNLFQERMADADIRPVQNSLSSLSGCRREFVKRGYRSILALNILVPSYLFGGFAEIFRGRTDIGVILLFVPVILGVAGWLSVRSAGRTGKKVNLRVISQSEHTDMAVAYIVIYLFPAVHPHPWLALLLLTVASLIIEVGADPFPANPMFKVFGRRLATVDIEEEDGVRRRIVLIVPKEDRTIPAHVRAVSLGGGVFLLPPENRESYRTGTGLSGERTPVVRDFSGARKNASEGVTNITNRRDARH
ncbi:MAG: hypothetical protein C75L2_00380140 [Leptospirillum sp. Group II 'C75']|jgi:hypothetical protein|uniref:Uncharacterized protein n=1 Tax=Leptospirillum sp. Group II '5-way CG' TaxID=419541 RepID=B6ARN2_9BACT|nr:MAG: protein of unknown function [Leptospirillum rubarum]EDZ38128.1 MAG: Protein of unknown function [Leptospirillum sp. Group II '5-way CG']EIJ76775.1 MAG: hypothetical protein C75L2_00380140 [Leptospirillum sp. Group II 'C75']